MPKYMRIFMINVCVDEVGGTQNVHLSQIMNDFVISYVTELLTE